MSQKIAFITYETPFAPSGGIAAVMGRLPASIARASQLPTFILTPYHYNISKTVALKDQFTSIGKVIIPYNGNRISVKIHNLEREVNWCFLEAEDDRFFGGDRHPYDLTAQNDLSSKNLLRDTLFFGCAAARVLPFLDKDETWIVMMQDWEAATTALALADQADTDFKIFLTLHNSYDSGVTDSDLLRFDLNPSLTPGDTVLQRALTIVQKPVFTVSDQFGIDFSEEPLQSAILAPHLKTPLTDQLIGINNGVFTDISIDDETLRRAKKGDFEPLRQWKDANRAQALKALNEFTPTKEKPVWGNLSKFKPDDAPWFVLAGRDDPRQKGYDVACLAITEFLKSGGQARFLFFPIPGDEGLPGLIFLNNLAQEFSASVLVLPFIFQEGYFSTLQGATYGIMPSLYEPFGMANEFYLKGTVGIGRATGGIIQQIIPLRSASSFSQAVQVRSERYFGASAQPTGILYRERDGIPTTLTDWRAINAADYDKTGKSPNRMEQRSQLPLFHAMVRELQLSIEDGVSVYEHHPDLYYEMLSAGINYIQRTFSWERAAHAYLRYLL